MSKKREMKVIKQDESNFDKILSYHINPEAFPLSEALESVRLRWNEVLTLRLQGFTKQMIVKKWKTDKDISPAQAYIDIRNSESLYGNVLKAEKEGSRVLWMQWVEDYLMRARQRGDMKAEGVALKLIAEYGDFKGEDNPEFNPAKLENVKIEFNIPKEALNVISSMANKGVHDFNNLSVTDVEHEDLTDDATS